MSCSSVCEWKSPVRGATTGDRNINITLSGAFVDDGINYADGDRVLVKDHHQPELNGIYIVDKTGRWSRAVDAKDESTLLPGSMVPVLEGFTHNGRSNRGLVYRLVPPSPPYRIDQSPLEFAIAIGDKSFTAEDFGAVPVRTPVGVATQPDQAPNLERMFDAQWADSTSYIPEGCYAVRQNIQLESTRKVLGHHMTVDTFAGDVTSILPKGNTILVVPDDVGNVGAAHAGFDRRFPTAQDPIQNALFFTFNGKLDVEDLEIWCNQRVNYGFFTGHHAGSARFSGITVDSPLLDGFRFNVCQAAEFKELRITNAGRHGIRAANCNALTLYRCSTFHTPFGAGIYLESTFLTGDGASGGAYLIGPVIEGPQRYGIACDSILSKLVIERSWIEALGPLLDDPTNPTRGRNSDGIFLYRCRYADVQHSQISNSSSPPMTFTADATTNVITTQSGHGFVNGDAVTFVNSGGSLPGGLNYSEQYFVINVTAVSFKVAASPGGTEVDITAPGTGVHTVLDAKQNVRLRHSYGCSIEHNLIANNTGGPTIRLEGESEGNVIRDNWVGAVDALIPVTVESNRLRNEIKTWIEGGEPAVSGAEAVSSKPLAETQLEKIDSQTGPLFVATTTDFNNNDLIRVQSLANPGIFDIVRINGRPSASSIPLNAAVTGQYTAGDAVTALDVLNAIAGKQLTIDAADIGQQAAPQVITFPTTPFQRASEVPTFINRNTTGVSAFLKRNRLIIRSETGNRSRIAIDNSGAGIELEIGKTVLKNGSKPDTLPMANWKKGDRIKNAWPQAGSPAEWVYVQDARDDGALNDDVVVPTSFAFIQQREFNATAPDVTASTLWITDPTLIEVAALQGGHDGQVITIESRRAGGMFCQIRNKTPTAGNIILAYGADLFLAAGETVRLQRRSLNQGATVEWVQTGMSGQARPNGGPGLMDWRDALHLRVRLLGTFKDDSGPSQNLLLDFATSLHRKATLTQDTTFVVSSLSDGEPGVVHVTQDSTGNHRVTWPGAVKFHGTNGQPDPAPNSTTQFLVFVDGATLHVLGTGNTVATDIIVERTANAGVTIENLLIKNGRLDSPKYRRRDCAWHKENADASPLAVTSERCFFRAEDAVTLTGAFFCPDSGLTANSADNATLVIRKRDGVGGAPGTVAAYTTDLTGGGLAAFQPKSFGPLGNSNLAAGNILTFEIAKAGAGVVVPTGKLIVHFTVD